MTTWECPHCKTTIQRQERTVQQRMSKPWCPRCGREMVKKEKRNEYMVLS